MFGYVRPYKPELLIRQWDYYRSAYCGLCKEIGKQYGQLPRLALTYDMTFLVVFLNSLTRTGSQQQKGICMLNPTKARLIMNSNKPLEFAAAVTVLLAHYKGVDDRQDGKVVRGNAVVTAFSGAKRKVLRSFPQLNSAIEQSLNKLAAAEQGEPDIGAAENFGELLASVFSNGVRYSGIADDFSSQDEREALISTVRCFGYDLGRWIYLIDAIDDYAVDMDNEEWNPYAGRNLDEARKAANSLLSEIEISLDRTAALLPFVRDSALIANLIRQGLPYVRTRIIAGAGLEKM